MTKTSSSKSTKSSKSAAKTSAKKTATVKATRIMDDMKLVVVKRENPFADGTVQAKHAAAVLASSGKTVADAKKRGADSWTVRALVQRKLVRVEAVAA